jgi:cytidylate kinase
MSESTREGPIVTLDGPAGSGKSTTAREVARRLGYRHLDSGALYRALTYGLMAKGVPTTQWTQLTEDELRGLDVHMVPTSGGYEVRVAGRVVEEELRGPEITTHASKLSALPAVRGCLLELQREAGARGALVADGRDMGTVVFPDAEVKVYLVAGLDERARRRLLDRREEAENPEAVAREARAIAERDRRDSSREHSPLRRPDDAQVIDTTGMGFEDQVEAVVNLVRELTIS